MGNSASNKNRESKEIKDIQQRLNRISSQNSTYLNGLKIEKQKHQREIERQSSTSSHAPSSKKRHFLSSVMCMNYCAPDSNHNISQSLPSEPSQTSRKQKTTSTIWLSDLIFDLRQLANLKRTANEEDFETHWSYILAEKLQQLITSEQSLLRFTSSNIQDSFFLKRVFLTLPQHFYLTKQESISEEIQMLNPQQIPQQAAEIRGTSPLTQEILPSEEFRPASKSLVRAVSTIDIPRSQNQSSKYNICIIEENERLGKSEGTDKHSADQLPRSATHFAIPNQQSFDGTRPQVEFKEISEDQRQLKELLKEREWKQIQIAKLLYHDNEVFEYEVESVFERVRIANIAAASGISLNASFSPAQSVSLDSKQYSNGSIVAFQTRNKNSSQSDIAKRENAMIAIAQQTETISCLKFSQKIRQYLLTQIMSDSHNWINKLLRFFISILCQQEEYKAQEGESKRPFASPSLTSSTNENQNLSNKPISADEGAVNDCDTFSIPSIQSSPSFSGLPKILSEIKDFSRIMQKCIENFYEFKFLSIINPKATLLLTEDILHNFTINALFSMKGIGQSSLYALQLQTALVSHHDTLLSNKRKFEQLSMKEPQFFNIKDQYCLNRLTELYIVKQNSKKNLKRKYSSTPKKSSNNPESQSEANSIGIYEIETEEELQEKKDLIQKLETCFSRLREAEARKSERARLDYQNVFAQVNLPFNTEHYPHENMKKGEEFEKQLLSLPYAKCIEYLQKITIETKPMAKLRNIVQAFDSIQQSVQLFYEDNQFNEKAKMGPEDLMDITVYILVKSQQYQIIHDIEFIRSFITEKAEFSDKTGYYLLTLEAAYSYIIETNLDNPANLRVSFGNSFKSFCGGN